MGVDVVGVAVAAVGVVGHDDVGALLANDRDECANDLTFVGVDEPLATPFWRALHPRVAPPARTAEIDGALTSSACNAAVSSPIR